MLAFIVADASANPPRYRIVLTDLPSIAADPATFPEPYMGINDKGEVVSTVATSDGVNHPFVWLPTRNPTYDYASPTGMAPGTHALFTEANDFNVRADITGGTVSVNDLLAVITNWGPCSCFPAQEPVLPLTEALTEAGLSQSDWNEYLDVMFNGTSSQIENYKCWMERYLTQCRTCPQCPGRDPFTD